MMTLKNYRWPACFLLVFVLLLGGFILLKPRVLILYAYSKQSPLVPMFNSGVIEALKGNRTPLTLTKYYMSTDNFPPPDQLNRKRQEAIEAVRHQKPDVIVAVGQQANQLLALHISELNPKTKIVYVSVESDPAEMGYPSGALVTGIKRYLPIDGIREFIERSKHLTRFTVAVLGSHTTTNQYRLNTLIGNRPKGLKVETHLLSNCFDEWQRFIAQSAMKSDVLIVLPTGSLRQTCGADSRPVERSQFIPWIEANSKALPIGLDGNFVKEGGGVSFYPSYSQEGRQALSLALRMVDGPNQNTLPNPINNEDYQVAIDPDRLKARRIFVPTIYLEYSQHAALIPLDHQR